MKKISKIGIPLTFALSLIPQSATAKENKQVAHNLINEAVTCVLTAKPGKTVLIAESAPGRPSQKRIVVVTENKRLTVDVTKTYPHPYIEEIDNNGNSKPRPDIKRVQNIPTTGDFRVRQPYLQIFQRKNGTSDSQHLKGFFDGSLGSGEKNQPKLNGLVNGGFLEDEKKLAYPLNKDTREKYQQKYKNAIDLIIEGCRKN